MAAFSPEAPATPTRNTNSNLFESLNEKGQWVRPIALFYVSQSEIYERRGSPLPSGDGAAKAAGRARWTHVATCPHRPPAGGRPLPKGEGWNVHLIWSYAAFGGNSRFSSC